MTDLSQEMAARYGTDRPRRGTTALAIVAIVVFVGIIGYVTWRLGSPAVQSNIIRFSVVSDEKVDVLFEVHRTGESATTCVLRGQGIDHADVAYATVTITPGRSYVQATYPLATSSRATTVEVLGCSDDGPPRVDPPQFVPGTVNPSQVPTIDGS